MNYTCVTSLPKYWFLICLSIFKGLLMSQLMRSIGVFFFNSYNGFGNQFFHKKKRFFQRIIDRSLLGIYNYVMLRRFNRTNISNKLAPKFFNISARKILKTVLEISDHTQAIYICIFNDFYNFRRVPPLMGPKL